MEKHTLYLCSDYWQIHMYNKLNGDEMKEETPQRVRVICFVTTTHKNSLYDIQLIETIVKRYDFKYNGRGGGGE